MLLLLAYALYKYYEHDQEEKAKHVRKVEFFKQQAILAQEARAELARFIQEQEDREAAIKMQRQQEKEERRAARHRQQVIGGGAYATGPVQAVCAHDLKPPQSPQKLPTAKVNNVDGVDCDLHNDSEDNIAEGSVDFDDLSTLHSSEMSSGLYRATHYSISGSEYGDDSPIDEERGDG